jgi:hypothetical protein
LTKRGLLELKKITRRGLLELKKNIRKGLLELKKDYFELKKKLTRRKSVRI